MFEPYNNWVTIATPMRNSALIGHLTEHSISTMSFEWIAKRLPRPMEYSHLLVDILRASELVSDLEAFRTLDFCGHNVALLRKLDVVPILNRVDGSIPSIGAVKTVVFDSKNNQLVGYNTDWYGTHRPLANPLCM